MAADFTARTLQIKGQWLSHEVSDVFQIKFFSFLTCIPLVCIFLKNLKHKMNFLQRLYWVSCCLLLQKLAAQLNQGSVNISQVSNRKILKFHKREANHVIFTLLQKNISLILQGFAEAMILCWLVTTQKLKSKQWYVLEIKLP